MVFIRILLPISCSGCLVSSCGRSSFNFYSKWMKIHSGAFPPPVYIPYSIRNKNWWKSSLKPSLSSIHIVYSLLVENWCKSSLKPSLLPIHIPYAILIQTWWKYSEEPPSSHQCIYLIYPFFRTVKTSTSMNITNGISEGIAKHY